MVLPEAYQARKFNLHGLNGISDQTLEMRFKLYEGYVKGTNTLNEQTWELLQAGPSTPEKMPLYAELKRRLGFEYNGLRLHECYFESLTSSGGAEPARGALFRQAAEASFGSYERWKTDFTNVGKMRGVGWAVTLQDLATGRLSNHWIELHENNYVAGFKPILVMDVWEHAYLLDYQPADRPLYLEAFYANIDWPKVEQRLNKGKAAQAHTRV